MTQQPADTLNVGWASTDITPTEPVVITGQFHARVSDGVADPISATALALEAVNHGSAAGRCIMVSCDVVAIPDNLRDAVREHLASDLPEVDPLDVIFNATHTHAGPEVRVAAGNGGNVPPRFGVELDVMPADKYVSQIARKIADAVIQAWNTRQPGGMAFGLGHASLGYNRRISFYTGETRMYGGVGKPDFSHIEGGDDTSVNVMGFYTPAGKLTGVVINVACPSQATGGLFQISADYWHELRQTLRQQLGQDIYILPQCSAAGDLVPAHRSMVPDFPALDRMWQLQNISQRQDIANHLSAAVIDVLGVIGSHVDYQPALSHRAQTVELTRRLLSQQDVDEAIAESKPHQQAYDQLKAQYDADPQAYRQQARWYVELTKTYRRANWCLAVAERFQQQQTQPRLPYELHAVRLGDVAIAANPFELYRDYGHQIKAGSPAVQTFVVQLAGPGSYLPTQRAASGGSYGAQPASTPIGPEGGRELVLHTLEALHTLWPQEQPAAV